jgi:diguanylate cyclase (GGDEF)-like protein
MPGFDPRSFILISALLGLLCACIFFILRHSFPKDIRGLDHWAVACLAMMMSAILFSLRGSISVLYSSFLANILVVGGIMLMYASLRRFEGHRQHYRQLIAILVAMALLLICPTFIRDDYRMRIIVVSAVNTTLFAACAMAIQQMKQRSLKELFTKIVFLFAASVSLLRYITAILQHDTLRPEADTSILQRLYMATFSFSVLALSLGFMLMVNRKLRLKLERVALHDSLTGTYTRGAFFDLLGKEMARSHRSSEPVSLLMLDLDNFKAINDRYGHLGGDQVLVDFAQKVNRILRPQDVFGRYGGEEFTVLLPNTSQEEACHVAERICLLSEQADSQDIPRYTVSIGMTTVRQHCPDINAFVRRADHALYEAKKLGKNRVAMHAG